MRENKIILFDENKSSAELPMMST